MGNIIEDILYEAHKKGKRGELIKSLNIIREKNQIKLFQIFINWHLNN
jgi:hypothetical protein